MKKYTVLRSYSVYQVYRVEAADEDEACVAVEGNLLGAKYEKSFDGKYNLDFVVDEGWDVEYKEDA